MLIVSFDGKRFMATKDGRCIISTKVFENFVEKLHLQLTAGACLGDTIKAAIDAHNRIAAERTAVSDKLFRRFTEYAIDQADQGNLAAAIAVHEAVLEVRGS